MKAKKCFSVITMLVIFVLGLIGCAKQVKVVTLDKYNLEVPRGETFVLNAAIFPNDADDQSVVWSVDSASNAVSATTNENTLQKEFLAANLGDAKIRVISSNGKADFCDVKVVESEEDKAAREKKAEEERIAAEKKAEEERIAAEKKAKEERTSYETGITYDQLARTPDDYIGKKVKFYGRVRVYIATEEDGETQLLIATKATPRGTYLDDEVYVYYNSSLTPSRVLKDDMVTIYGISKGLYNYGGRINPLIEVRQIEIE